MCVVAEEPLFGTAICALLEKEPWLAPFSARSLRDSVRRLDQADEPSALVVVVRVAAEQLFDRLARMRKRLPAVGVCLVAERVDPVELRRVVSGAPGSFALLKRASMPTRRDLLVALQALVSGRVLLPPQELETMVADADTGGTAWDSLSASECMVMELVADGLRNRDIADRVGRTEKAIEHMVGRLYSKLTVDCERDRRVMLARLVIAHRQDGAGDAARAL